MRGTEKMKIATAVEKARKKGLKGTLKYCAKKICGTGNAGAAEQKINILLLTNRDSDNVGDQVIEACDLALIKAVMKNLKVKEEEYEIDSQAASIVSKKYLSEKEDSLLKTAEWHIRKSDVVIFGGAPLFNYQYQVFYERTAVTLEIALKYRKPVIFSAIGIEGYDEDNKKCQRLKKTLNFDCVKQITTRDGMEDLKNIAYYANECDSRGDVSNISEDFVPSLTDPDASGDYSESIAIEAFYDYIFSPLGDRMPIDRENTESLKNISLYVCGNLGKYNGYFALFVKSRKYELNFDYMLKFDDLKFYLDTDELIVLWQPDPNYPFARAT